MGASVGCRQAPVSTRQRTLELVAYSTGSSSCHEPILVESPPCRFLTRKQKLRRGFSERKPDKQACTGL
eukprot:COSAG06_NODE_120_length_23106_cov_18.311862_11_plen_69_part_00